MSLHDPAAESAPSASRPNSAVCHQPQRPTSHISTLHRNRQRRIFFRIVREGRSELRAVRAERVDRTGHLRATDSRGTVHSEPIGTHPIRGRGLSQTARKAEQQSHTPESGRPTTGRRTDEPTEPRQELQTTRARTNSAETKAKHQLIPPAQVACPLCFQATRQSGSSPPRRRRTPDARSGSPDDSTAPP